MNEVVVSIVMPTHNSEKTIESTIDSVRFQSFKKWELIVVDDFSKDSTLGKLDELISQDSRISYIALDKNYGGPAHPRNIGVAKSKGKYIAFLDDDDLWHHNKLELQLKIMQDEGKSFSSTKRHCFNDSEEKNLQFNSDWNLSNLKNEYISHNDLIYKNFIANSSVVLEKRLLNGEKFNEDCSYVAVEDYEMWLRIHQSLIESSLKIDLPLLFYRVSEDGISSQKFKMIKKINNLLANYEVEGKSLGFLKNYYMLKYIYTSLKDRVLNKVLGKTI